MPSAPRTVEDTVPFLESPLSQSFLLQVTEANLLLVDNPVGTGYSYVDNDYAYAKDMDTITSDLLALMVHFMDRYPGFKVM